MATFRTFTPGDIQSIIRLRNGEQKLGEHLLIGEAPEVSTARFVILGLPEDIGVRANEGIGGTASAWPAFLKSFLNIQETDRLRGADFLLWGQLSCTDWLEESAIADVSTLRALTGRIDDLVFPLIHQIIAAGKIPVVIGGGHNNAYPLIKGAATALNNGINAINVDAHADFRPLEGRHSGNGFRYAYEEGYLKNYALLGLHEAYNNTTLLTELETNKDIFPLFWEDIFMRQHMSWDKAMETCLAKIRHQPFGVELDLDSIEHVLSSAATPVGISTAHAMRYLYQCGLQPKSCYMHLPEGVSQRADGQESVFTGKLLSYLVQAFCKGVLERKNDASSLPL